MITTKILPAHILRLFIWEVLKLEGVMPTVNGLIPIVPVEDEPKLADSGKAYAVYGYAENDGGNLDEITSGVMSIRVTAPTFAELGHILNTIARAFESVNKATEAVNIWSSNYPNQALVGLRFTRTKTSYVEGGEPADEEGGPVDGVVGISYAYITNHTVQLPVNSGLWN